MFNITGSGGNKDYSDIFQGMGKRKKRDVFWKDYYTDVAAAITTGDLVQVSFYTFLM